jgi:hypothetical protein
VVIATRSGKYLGRRVVSLFGKTQAGRNGGHLLTNSIDFSLGRELIFVRILEIFFARECALITDESLPRWGRALTGFLEFG